MKISLFFINFFLILNNLSASDSLVLKKSIPINSHLFTTDPIGNFYVVVNNNSLIKYNKNGDSISSFNEITKGKISHIDATNPLRILLFIADYAHIIILDNLLSKKHSFKITDLGIFNASCIAQSQNNNIWIYDPIGELINISENQKVLFNIPLRNILDAELQPVSIVELNNNLYIVDTTYGLFSFDQFGYFQKQYNIKTKDIQYFNSQLVYFNNQYLYTYHINSMNEKKIKIHDSENIIKIRLERNQLYILRKNFLELYTFYSEN